ncbi:hypothetical protein CERSUDRAFT_112176 [Gelatoporia subvermispora B]|uniref:Zn(2)-C6 fungal-type domain-containing protein n=1 Tax=Ceriporiopsis subvermispora (strain B) TaxID=914234 RepID=M2RM74_CERS8|nr:hypothetical protein CERSUDRAFT_112176 [Gelatoporia subvermispora B]
MLSIGCVPQHAQAPSTAIPDGHDDSRPLKRPRQAKELDDGLRPYALPAAAAPSGASPENDTSPDAGFKRNRKRPLSCGECRRLKLKCDRVFPCQSCCKRGCAEICPEGALTGGKGSRFILANTEQLHEKIKVMSERIRVLEDALQSLHQHHSNEAHPLLAQELLLIKKSPELFGVDRNGMSNAAYQDYLRQEDAPPTPPKSRQDEYHPLPAMSITHPQDLPEDLCRISRNFPAEAVMAPEIDPHLRQRIRDMLPSREEANRLCDRARSNAFWLYNPDASESFLPNLIHSVYTQPLIALLPHRLSLFYMLLAIGSSVDLMQDNHQHQSEKYHQLARVALCETPIIDEPSFDGIHSVFHMVWHLLMFSDNKKALEHAWGIMGLLAKLAQSLGLHRDVVRSKVIPEELDKRRALLWNIVEVDMRLALMLRRPPSFSIEHIDAKPVVSIPDGGMSPGGLGTSYHAWMNGFLVRLMAPVLESVICTQPPSYSDVLGLDGKIRDFEVPLHLRMIDNDGLAPKHPLGMQQGMVLCSRETAILHLHRNYFTQALSVSEGFTVKHQYAPSVLATFSSSCNLIWAVTTCYRWEPDLVLRILMLWSNCFSAAVALCLLVSRAPSCPLSVHALVELDRVVRLFSEVRHRCSIVAKAYPVLDKLVNKSRHAYMNWRNGSQQNCDENDEICVIARRTGIIMSPSRVNMAVDTESTAFEHAHPSLLKCLEQAASETACMSDPFASIRGPLRSLLSSGMSRSYNTSAERTMQQRGMDTSSESGYDSAAPSAQAEQDFSGVSSAFSDSSWMTWF